jgi:putative FmdB family regulatory protein
MPIYAYRCESCGVQFDRRQTFNDPPLKRCPECGETALRKLYQPVGIVFKGSGFYATDHRSPSGRSHSKSSEGSKPSDKSPDTSSSDGPSESKSSQED